MADKQPSKAALKNMAGELEIEGRSNMPKEELAEAIVEELETVASPAPSSDEPVGMLPPR